MSYDEMKAIDDEFEQALHIIKKVAIHERTSYQNAIAMIEWEYEETISTYVQQSTLS